MWLRRFEVMVLLRRVLGEPGASAFTKFHLRCTFWRGLVRRAGISSLVRNLSSSFDVEEVQKKMCCES